MAVREVLRVGDSYLFAEIKAIHRCLRAVASNKRVYGFKSVILKGTKLVERMSASASVINWLSHYPSCVVVSTHDKVLTDIMGDQCINVHFQEKESQKDGVVLYTYLHQGPATSHNAMSCCATMAYPVPQFKDARQLAADFERNKAWPKYRQGGIQASQRPTRFCKQFGRIRLMQPYWLKVWIRYITSNQSQRFVSQARRRDAKPRQPKPMSKFQAEFVCGHGWAYSKISFITAVKCPFTH